MKIVSTLKKQQAKFFNQKVFTNTASFSLRIFSVVLLNLLLSVNVLAFELLPKFPQLQPSSIFSEYGSLTPLDTSVLNESHAHYNANDNCLVVLPEEINKAIGYLGWGNNTGGDADKYTEGFKHFASHGIIVAAAKTGQAVSGVEMRDCVETVLRKYGSQGVPQKVMYAGHSQGGGGALSACADDDRCNGTVLMNGSIKGGFLFKFPQENLQRQNGHLLSLASKYDLVAGIHANHYPIFRNTNVPAKSIIVDTLPGIHLLNPLYIHDKPLGDFHVFKAPATAFILSIMANNADGLPYLETVGNLRGYSLDSRGEWNSRAPQGKKTHANQLSANVIYLDRHHLNCGAGAAISQLRLKNLDNRKMQYHYTCEETQLDNRKIAKRTAANTYGRGANVYLDRHPVNCNNKALVSMRLLNAGNRNMYYAYECGTRTLGKITWHTTPSQTHGNYNTIYLDRHNVKCPQGKVLSYLRLERPNRENIRYRYSCGLE